MYLGTAEGMVVRNEMALPGIFRRLTMTRR